MNEAINGLMCVLIFLCFAMFISMGFFIKGTLELMQVKRELLKKLQEVNEHS